MEGALTPRPPDTAATTQRYCAAMLSDDLDELASALASNCVLRSPISPAATFEGRAAICDLMAIVLTVISEIQYLHETGDHQQRVLFASARVGRETFEEVVWLRFDQQALISELTLLIRPLPGLTALTAALATAMATRQSRLRGIAAGALTRPLAAATRAGDPIALRLAGVPRR